MKENKHTPGEWKVDGNQSNAVVVDTGDTYPKLIAECGDERDAQLIASAKELLGALESVIVWNMTAATERDWTSYRLAVVEQARQAIAKAKGGM